MGAQKRMYLIKTEKVSFHPAKLCFQKECEAGPLLVQEEGARWRALGASLFVDWPALGKSSHHVALVFAAVISVRWRGAAPTRGQDFSADRQCLSSFTFSLGIATQIIARTTLLHSKPTEKRGVIVRI